jgi:hypothetical protein
MRSTILVAAALAVGACSAGKAESGGPVVSRAFPVGSFDKIEVAGPFDVAVTTGGQPAVSARGSAGLVDKMVVKVDGSTLKIHPEKRSGWFGKSGWSGAKAKVTVSVPMLDGAAVAGSGDLQVDRVDGSSFAGEVAGSGNLRLAQLRVQNLKLEIAGSGNVQAAGQATEARYEIAGSGDIQASRVTTQQARAEIAGSGKIEAHAARNAQIDIAGSGNVRITGGGKCTISKAGSGNVDCS